jgi:hypothetical protein
MINVTNTNNPPTLTDVYVMILFTIIEALIDVYVMIFHTQLSFVEFKCKWARARGTTSRPECCTIAKAVIYFISVTLNFTAREKNIKGK